MISVVIPSYNRCDCIVTLLTDVFAQQGAEFEVIVVDDCSPDHTVEVIRERFPEVKLLVNERNGGPCVTRNRGVMAAKGDLIVGLDSDVSLPSTDLFARVEETFRAHDDVVGLAFRIFKPDGVSEDVERWWHPVPVEAYAEKAFFTDYFSGTGYAFRRQAMIDGGLYPEYLYMHYEEVELAFRILDNGGKILHCPDLKVLHHEGKAAGRSKVQLYYKPRNQILLALSCYPLGRAVTYLVPRVGFQFLRAAGNRHLGSYIRAMIDGVRKGQERLSERRPLKGETLDRIKRLKEGVTP